MERLAQCPFCNNQETHQHYLHCIAPENMQHRRKLKKDIKQKLQKIGVYEGIISHLINELSNNNVHCNEQIQCTYR